METKVINGSTIYIKDGKKYRKPPHGKLRELCQVENCIKRTQNGCGHYCFGCITELSGGDAAKRKQLIEDSHLDFKKKNEESKFNYQMKLEDAMTIIDEVEIYIIESKKYRKNVDGQLRPACSYKDCNKFAHHDQLRIYCNNHKGGTDETDELRKKEKEEMIAKAKVHGQTTHKIGNASESWVSENLKLIKDIESVEMVGFTGSKYDIEIRLKGDVDTRGIQVKTLSKCKRYNDSYNFEIQNENYSNNTLFIGVNIERTRFIVMFYKDFQSHTPTFNYLSAKSKYRQYMFTDNKSFMNVIKSALSKIDKCDRDCRQIYHEYENESLLRLKEKCAKVGVEYHRVEDGSDKIDCIINGYNIQHKTCSSMDDKSYRVSIKKNNGKKNGKRVFIPYSETDGIDFFIIELLDFKNDFYIIPINVLIEKGYIQTNTISGRQQMRISRSNNNTPRSWVKEYLNKFDLLK